MNPLRVEMDSRPWRDATALHWLLAAAWWCLCVGLQLARWAICALLVLGEPVVRAVLVPVAFLSFLVTLIFGFLIGDVRFPRWGMLAFSVSALILYWLYLGLMSLFMTLPSHDHER
ncbi:MULTISPECIES: hypothetical protein [unclassified Variovorax]|uniref:hypothetical protein n=1 Tax=unclassified Variovorax TaxID=663243 RepID=UPI00076CC443|nr:MULTISPECIES: hypothetical protein [unclassified Variovorax]KWT71761.1 hypothetical protein APY03_6487 [Variovorax sp. WDL1]PNG46127.1 hypothetical protein CHC06_08105 [Variovorax sp. B2]PNG46214.1 hypothetical protein CHC07_07962 [Variovorax sp. B4]VTV19251.1 hypothetical protein WDL1P3_00178 [Variovorax sp. WDL1]